MTLPRQPFMHRFYLPASLTPPRVQLSGDEAHHMSRVLRLSVGTTVELFDGTGASAMAEIVRSNKQTATLDIIQRHDQTPTLRPQITLLTAAPKSDRLRWLVEKATELGVHRLSLIETQHSVVHPGDGKLEKLRAAVIAACKQSGRNDLMTIDPPKPLTTTIDAVVAKEIPLVIATHGGGPFASTVSDVACMAIAIGPEGGFTAAEVADAIDRGGTAVSLGPLTLRIETACLAAVSAIRLASCDAR